jgi:exodeoxyribonuclease V gamma subunit
MATSLKTGLLVLHGNRLEDLAEVVLRWLAAHPPGALEEECLLVQSNGMAEWLKMEMAAGHGVCAATRVELPARFLWRAYRAVLGRAAVPGLGATDKLPLTWRLMRLLREATQTTAIEEAFEPLARFLGDGSPARRLQLAQRVSDLFDSYQVYRADWLQDWAEGRDLLRRDAQQPPAAARPVPADQRWQAELWRQVLSGLSTSEREAIRPALHRRFIHALNARRGNGLAEHPWVGLPRRVVLFGTTHIPYQTLEALLALSPHVQLILAVPNPCRFHWADIIEGREWWTLARHRQPLREGRELAPVPLAALHAHGHPLLAAWGRQARDFVRQLDAFDDVQRSRAVFDLPRVDLFDEGPGSTLLQSVQARIRDLVPLAEHRERRPDAADRSIVFHVAHSAQREVEVLHDQLLHLFAHPPAARPLQPRQVVVMVPQIEDFTAAIRAVFGQYPRGHARHIPWGIADLGDRGRHPLLLAVDWLLRGAHERFTASQMRELLELPAVARRLGLAADEVAAALAWIEDAGIRWGLHLAHRSTLGLPECGEVNSWAWGLRRMLLGYATGELDEGFAGIEPFAEVAGLSAGIAGVLAEWIERLDDWWQFVRRPHAPRAWAPRLRALLAEQFEADDEDTRAMLAALDDALARWLEACEAADFDDPLDAQTLGEAWLGAVDDSEAWVRFRSGGVTFCTLLPLRAIPFEVVCLLGMNEGDYPRRGARSDFDLLGLPGCARPGDRSRRDDDRQLMLDALLSARRMLYLSWTGRSVRDNQEQPPSVLVSQLRDYLDAAWGQGVCAERTVQHPLQPFSAAYFAARPDADRADSLFTYASEWREALVGIPVHSAAVAGASAAPAAHEAPPTLSLDLLARFVRNPVQAFFRERLKVRFEDTDVQPVDDEPFEVDGGLTQWTLIDDLLGRLECRIASCAGAPMREPGMAGGLVAAEIARLRRAGRLPLAGPGDRSAAGLQAIAEPMLVQWLRERDARAHELPPLEVLVRAGAETGLELVDRMAGLRAPHARARDAAWISWQASRLTDKGAGKRVRPEKLVRAWLLSLASAAAGRPSGGVLIGADAVLRIEAASAEEAESNLRALLQLYEEGVRRERPLAAALRTGLSWLDAAGDMRKPAKVYDGDAQHAAGEGREASLARRYPSFDDLRADAHFESDTRRLYSAYRAWLAKAVRIEPLPDMAEVAGDADD